MLESFHFERNWNLYESKWKIADAWPMIWSSIDYCLVTLIIRACIWFGTLHDTSYRIHVACSHIVHEKYPCVFVNNLEKASNLNQC